MRRDPAGGAARQERIEALLLGRDPRERGCESPPLSRHRRARDERDSRWPGARPGRRAAIPSSTVPVGVFVMRSTLVARPSVRTPKLGMRHPRSKLARGVLLLAAIPFFAPGLLPSLPAPAVEFVCGALLLVPLGTAVEVAMEYLVEHLRHIYTRRGGAKHGNIRSQFIGGFVHAFASNVAYLILTATVLLSAAGAPGQGERLQLVGIVQSSIAGSLVISILCILGIATIVGGLRHKGLPYDRDLANAYSEMLTVAVIALALPSLAYKLSLSVGFFDRSGSAVFRVSEGDAARLSDITAVALIVVFVGYTLFTVFRFRATDETLDARAALSPFDDVWAADGAAASAGRAPRARPLLVGSLLFAIVCIGGTVFVSERMAHAAEASFTAAPGFGIAVNPFFLGFILLPVASHLEELVVAVSLTTHREPQMETCLAITVGSAIQVVLLVAPALVLLAHLYGVTEMSLIFSPFILAIYALIVFLFQVNVFDGKTDWLEGMEMTTFFGLLAVVAYLAGS